MKKLDVITSSRETTPHWKLWLEKKFDFDIEHSYQHFFAHNTINHGDFTPDTTLNIQYIEIEEFINIVKSPDYTKTHTINYPCIERTSYKKELSYNNVKETLKTCFGDTTVWGKK